MADHYLLLQRGNPSALSQDAEDLMHKGWVPVGRPFFVKGAGSRELDGVMNFGRRPMWYQAMARYAPLQ